MMNKATVVSVGYSSLNRCVTITYESEPGFYSYAAVAEKLSVKVGDTVWVLRNEELKYKGFSAVAVLLA